MGKLLVIDGNSIMNRQYYGIRPLTTKGGLFTNAVYGFMNVLFSQLETIKPDYAAVAFDLHAPTFRHAMYPEYKAGRHATPQELIMQFPYVKKCITAMGIRVLEKEGYEADDILGTLSALAEAEGDFCLVLTGDRDSLQLISDSCSVLLATNSEVVTFDRARFFEKYGVEPGQFVDVKALMGDSSDNIPGVHGIGEKTALKLIADYKTLDGVYESLGTMKAGSKVLENLTADKETAYLSQRLAKIDQNASAGISKLRELTIQPADKASLLDLFNELEFSAFIKKLSLNDATVETAAESISADELLTAELPFLLAVTYDKGSLSVCGQEGKCLSCNEIVRDKIKSFFDAHRFIVNDGKSLMHVLGEWDIKPDIAFDVMLAAYVLSPTDSSYSTEHLTQAYLGFSGSGASAVYSLYTALKEKLESDSLTELYENIEQPLSSLLYRMEKQGFTVDKNKLIEFSHTLETAANESLAEIYKLAGHEFNVNSTKQLATVLFDELKLPAFKKTKNGYSTGAEVLEKLRPYSPIIELILSYRQVTKLKTTYADGLYAAADEGSRVHSSFNQTVTATGRLSSTEPNLQNIPIRTPLGHEMRRCFVAPEDYVLIDADYSQIELRLLAHISRDPIMINSFLSGEDIHTSTASEVFGIPRAAVTPELRKRAKAINFGIVYGIGGYSLGEDIGVSKKEADAYISSYKARFNGVSEYLSAAVESAYHLGYVTTMFGRRRYIPELTSSKASLRSFGERVAMNSPIQGSAADIIKLAMVSVEKALEASGLDARLILQVHDELILESSEKDADKAAQLLKQEMESAVSLLVPLTVEVSTGKTWYDCK